MSVSPSVRHAWAANGRVNGALLEHLTPEMLAAQTPGGGYTVAQHLAEFISTTQYWGARFDEARLGGLPDPVLEYDGENGVFVPETDLSRLADIKRQTETVALEAADAAADMGSSPHASPDAYLIHMMVHDAHHRGQVLLALKTNGHPLPDETKMWGPWKDEA
jgi:uncharacterized damage-inducible protein DinB